MNAKDSTAKLGERSFSGALDLFPGRIETDFDRAGLIAKRFQVSADDTLASAIASFLRDGLSRLRPIGYGQLALGLSGGLDSVVAVRLAQLSGERVTAITVDLGRDGEAPRVEALRRCAKALDVEHVIVDGRVARAALLDVPQESHAWLAINIDTRIIQALIFREADKRDAAVLCTTDRSEKLLGRYTECFYGQLAPLGDLYKTEAHALAGHLGVLPALTETRPGCEDYWFDDDVLGAGYDVIDPVLHMLSAEGQSPEAIARAYAFGNADWLNRVAARMRDQPARVNESIFAVRR